MVTYFGMLNAKIWKKMWSMLDAQIIHYSEEYHTKTLLVNKNQETHGLFSCYNMLPIAINDNDVNCLNLFLVNSFYCASISWELYMIPRGQLPNLLNYIWSRKCYLWEESLQLTVFCLAIHCVAISSISVATSMIQFLLPPTRIYSKHVAVHFRWHHHNLLLCNQRHTTKNQLAFVQLRLFHHSSIWTRVVQQLQP